MYRTFDEMIDDGGRLGFCSVVVAAADRETTEAVKKAFDKGLGRAIFTGDENEITKYASEFGILDKCSVIGAANAADASRAAVAAICDGTGDVLVKGNVDTADFMDAVLDREIGLRAGQAPSHLAVIEIPGEKHLSFCTDSSLIANPTLKEKKTILRNALKAIHALGYEHVNVACIAANEHVDQNSRSAADASALVAAWRAGEFDDLGCTCTVEGPMAIDVAASAEAAARKGINSVIAGKVNLVLMPNLECGSVHRKTLVYYCKAKTAGVVVGAKVPIVLESRAADTEAKFRGIALACVIARGR